MRFPKILENSLLLGMYFNRIRIKLAPMSRTFEKNQILGALELDPPKHNLCVLNEKFWIF